MDKSADTLHKLDLIGSILNVIADTIASGDVNISDCFGEHCSTQFSALRGSALADLDIWNSYD